jgi:hypothetical protein
VAYAGSAAFGGTYLLDSCGSGWGSAR